MPISETTINEDIKTLMVGGPSPTPSVEPAAETEPETPEPEAAAPETAPEKPDVKPGTPDKALQRLQQENSALRKAFHDYQQTSDTKLEAMKSSLEGKLQKLLEVNGVKEEPAAAPKEEPKAEPAAPHIDVALQQEIAKTRGELKFIQIAQKHPESDPQKLWLDSMDESLKAFGIDEDATEYPAGVTPQAIQIVANRNFNLKVAALEKKTPPEKKPTTPPRKLPPKTPGGASATSARATHVPSTSGSAAIDSFREDCKVLLEGGPS